VNPRLIESYAQAFARFIQCEEAISTYGLLGKHPTTGGAIASPFVSMSQNFQKQANLIWYEIFDIVKQKHNDRIYLHSSRRHDGVAPAKEKGMTDELTFRVVKAGSNTHYRNGGKSR